MALLSLGTDLGLGQPMEHVMRQCLIALRLADHLRLDESDRAVVYYSGLLAWVGCHTDAYEQAKWFGDDITLKHDVAVDGAGPAWLLSHLGAGRPVFERARVVFAFLGDGVRNMRHMLTNHYLATDALAARLELGDDVRASLKQTFERWDGRGPLRQKGKQIHLTSRLVNLADVVEVVHRIRGVDAAVSIARARSGQHFDPDIVELFCANAGEVLGDLDATSCWDNVIAAEPALAVVVTEEKFDAALEAIADFADLKSPWRIGHARGVAELAGDAAPELGLPERDVRRAALVQDLGHLGIPNSIWDKRGPLTQPEQERLRLHPYLAERMLASSPVLAPLAALAVQHHERLDGSGYPRGISGEAITPAGRVLAAADVYQAMIEPRPYRPSRTRDEAAGQLRAMVSAGRLDGAAVDAVLRAARPSRASPPRVAGRTHGARGGSAPPRGARHVDQRDRARAIDHAEDRRQSRRAHLSQDRREQSCSGRACSP